MPGLFVTATGTEVGKTYVSCGLIGALRRRGESVAALKPIASGFDPDRAAESDTAALLAAIGLPLTPERVAATSPWRFRAPLSPDMAARREGAALPFAALVQTCRAAIAPGLWTVIEGIGGVMVPLGAGRSVLDLLVALDLPTVLVSPTGLGALSHLLTALEAMRSRALAATAVVLSETPDSTVPLDETVATLREHGLRDELAVLRRGPAEDQNAVFDAILARIDFAIRSRHKADGARV